MVWGRPPCPTHCSMEGLSARSVLVTGCDGGMGLELLKRFLELPTPPQCLFAACTDPDGKVRTGGSLCWGHRGGGSAAISKCRCPVTWAWVGKGNMLYTCRMEGEDIWVWGFFFFCIFWYRESYVWCPGRILVNPMMVASSTVVLGTVVLDVVTLEVVVLEVVALEMMALEAVALKVGPAKHGAAETDP